MIAVDDLRLFLRMVAAGGLSETARRLHSSPPAMSRRLAAMEARLGVRLVERSARRFLLTHEGALLHERATRIVAEIDAVEAEIGAKGHAPSGTLRIGAPMEIGRQRIAPLVGDFGGMHRAIRCELTLSDAGLDAIRDEFDFVFRTTRPEEPDVVAIPLLSGRHVACASPDYLRRLDAPRTPEDLTRHECLCLVRGRRRFDRWQFMRDGKPVMVQVEGSLSSTSGEVIHGWALEGRGIAFKAEWDIADDLRNGQLVECLANVTGDPMSLYGVFIARGYQPPRLRAFIDFVRQALCPTAPAFP